jgi:hypothetical protein
MRKTEEPKSVQLRGFRPVQKRPLREVKSYEPFGVYMICFVQSVRLRRVRCEGECLRIVERYRWYVVVQSVID